MTARSAEVFELDPRLAEDTADVCRLALCRVLLSRDGNYPWLILVPERPGIREIRELEPVDRAGLMDEIVRATDALELLFSPHKINVAALGNVVPQLHVHVIARFTEDAAWPKPVWGAALARAYEPAALESRLAELRAALAD
jgi:diadenosine tetraphosphate (Ap4A) HIT family hydrolase